MKRENKNKIKERGITLIALVITIVILIILAVVAINFAFGDNGLISQAQYAKTITEESQAREKLDLALIDLRMEKFMNPNYNTNQFVTDYLTSQGMVVQNDIVIVDGYQFIIDRENLTITQSLGKGNESKTIEIALNSNLSSDYTKATLTIEIQGSNTISKIQINGTDVNVPEEEENKYILTRDVTTNGIYSIFVSNSNEEYKIAQIQVTGISEDMQISTKEELANLRDRVNNGATYEGRMITLMNDIDLQGNADNQWIPIGRDDSLAFKGIFNGNNHVIENIYIDTTEGNQGLFGTVLDTTIQDLTITGNIVNAGSATGGIVGALGNSIIMNCHNEVTIYSGEGIHIGGIAGYMDSKSSILSCSNKSNITALGRSNDEQMESFIGGIAGTCEGKIEKCYNVGDIYGYCLAGGIAGGILQGEIRDSYNTGNIKVDYRKAGGIVGYIHYYSGGTIGYTRIINTYSTGIVTGTTQIGASIGMIALEESTILQADNNYALTQNNLPAIGGNITNANVKAELKTSEELKQLANALGEAFEEDTENINDGYPILQWQ